MARPDKGQSADEFVEKLVAVNRTAKVVKGGGSSASPRSPWWATGPARGLWLRQGA